MNKTLYILAELSDRDFDWLIHNGLRRSLTAGQTLIQEGESIDALYLVLTGSFKVTAKAVGDRELADLTAGELVGEMSFVDDRPPSATVQALEESTVWAIPRLLLSSKLSQDIGFAANFYRALSILLSDRLRSTLTRLGSIHDTDSRLDDVEPNTRILDTLDIAQVRLDWLLKQLGGVG
jgi:CRP/FNR family cyclic AMP-dependent transcriptional regulator